MCNQNIISNKFDLNLSTTLSSYYESAQYATPFVCKVGAYPIEVRFNGSTLDVVSIIQDIKSLTTLTSKCYMEIHTRKYLVRNYFVRIYVYKIYNTTRISSNLKEELIERYLVKISNSKTYKRGTVALLPSGSALKCLFKFFLCHAGSDHTDDIYDKIEKLIERCFIKNSIFKTHKKGNVAQHQLGTAINNLFKLFLCNAGSVNTDEDVKEMKDDTATEWSRRGDDGDGGDELGKDATTMDKDGEPRRK